MGGANQNRYKARFLYKDELLVFNRREKHIILHVDHDEDDPMDDQRSQGAWNKALNGKPSPDELVAELEYLLALQRDDPEKFLPKPPPENPRDWMAEIATRDWWADTFDVGRAQMTGWFTGRSTKLDGIVQEKVGDWYARLNKVATETSEMTMQGKKVIDKKRFLYHVLRLEEEGSEITNDQIKQMLAAWYSEPQIIDWQDPKPGYRDAAFDEDNITHRLCFNDACEWLAEARANDWDGIPSSLPPDGQWEKAVGAEKMWGGSNEDPHELNKPLYYKKYKAANSLAWDTDSRTYEMTNHRIISILDDDVWRAPTEREAKGWDEGSQFFWAELKRERDMGGIVGGIRQL
ncbi:hypothetical protein AB9F26_17245 [Falsihalocynthiibacter sp. BN13B15]|uniref:hypothetical protein n=1 Tax=Falsihalocynthiibacter sp. BN13B15 TaxID=3240871 RepID=UPI00350F0CFE